MFSDRHSARWPSHLSLPRPRTLFSRALRLRCPACGGHPIFLSWFTVCPSCPVCGFHLDRDEPGYWVGSYTVNLFLTEAGFALTLVGGIFLTWPAVPWNALLAASIAVNLILPIVVFPHSKMLYLAIDLTFRPPEQQDLATPVERGMALPRGPGSDAGRARPNT